MFFELNKILNYRWVKWVPLLIVIPVILISIFSYQSVKHTINRYANKELENAANSVSQQIDDFIRTTKENIGIESNLSIFSTYIQNREKQRIDPFHVPDKYVSDNEIVSTLNAFRIKNTPYSLSYALISKKGEVLIDTLKENTRKNESKEPYFTKTINSKSSIVDDVRFYDNATSYLISASPIFDDNNNVIGVLRVRYSPSILQLYINSGYGTLGKSSYAMLFDENFLKLADGKDPNDTFILYSASIFSKDRIAKLNQQKRLPPRYSFHSYMTDWNKDKESFAEETQIASIVMNDDSNLFDTFSKLNFSTNSLYSKMVVKTLYKNWYVLYLQPQQGWQQSLHKNVTAIIIILTIAMIFVILISLFAVQLLASLQNREKELNATQKELKKLLNLEIQWNKEIESDLSLGRKIQEAIQLIPKLPNDIKIITDQNAYQFVSGDSYFINWNPNHNLCTFFLQDIVGHGVQAALKASISHQIAKNIWSQDNIVDKRLKNYDSQLQEFFHNLHQETTDFNALVGAEFNVRTHILRIYRSNYVSPILIKPDQEVFSDTSTSNLLNTTWTVKPLVIKNRTEYQHVLKPGSVLIMLSDGYLSNSSSEMSLYRYFRSHINTPDFLDKGLDKYPLLIKEWLKTLETVPNDDRSIIVFQWLPNSRSYKGQLSTTSNTHNDPSNSSYFSVV